MKFGKKLKIEGKNKNEGKSGKIENWKSAKVKNLEKICGKLKFGKKMKIGKKKWKSEILKKYGRVEN